MSERIITLIDVAPVGTNKAIACGGGRSRIIDVPSYPRTEYQDRLREIRRARNITLRMAATILRMSVVDFSALEMGSKTTSELGWALVFEDLEAFTRAT